MSDLRDLLRQHVIAERKLPHRTEAPDCDPGAVAIKLVDVHVAVATNTVALAAMRSAHLEISIALKSRDLLGRQPFFEQGVRALFSSSALCRGTGLSVAQKVSQDRHDQRAEDQ